MPRLVVVTGPPGAGKSAASNALAQLLDRSAVVEGDAFFSFLAKGRIESWQPEAHVQNRAVVRAAAAAAGSLSSHCAVVYDGVLGPWFLPDFVAASGRPHLHYVCLLPPLATCLERVRTRTSHGFSDLDAAEHLWRDFARVGIDDRHLLSDGDADPASVARSILGRVSTGAALVRS